MSEDSRERLTEFWNRTRDYYELAEAANPEPSAERLDLFGHLQGGERVLDLGCGSCENALWLPHRCRYIGYDVSSVGLAMAAEAGRPGTRLRGDGRTLPLASESVDAVLSTWVLEHLHDPAGILLEAARVLRPGGLLLLVGSSWDLPYALPPSLDPRRRPRLALRRLVRQLRSLADSRHRFEIVTDPLVLRREYVPDADAVHVAQSVLLRRFLEEAGMEIVEQRSLAHRPGPSGPRAWMRAALRAMPLWRFAWGNVYLVARRGERVGTPPYELLPL